MDKIMQTRLRFWVLTLGLSALGGATLSSAAELANRTYEIRPQAVSTALKAFAAQSELQLIFTEKDVRESETSGVAGSLTPRDALLKMLEGTGLEFEFTANNVVVIRKARATE